MTTYKIQFQLKSSLRTPFHADTIFGHLCWAMRYLEGENRLKDWLRNYDKSPTLISNAFISGWFPRPVLPPYRVENPGDSPLSYATLFKKIKKIDLIPETWLREHQTSLTSREITEELLCQAENRLKSKPTRHKEVAVTHNSFDRLKGRAREGSLYDWEESFYLDQAGMAQSFWFYIKTETLTKDQVENMLDFIALSGYGADKSTGKGQIVITSLEENPLPECTDANAFLSLSNFIPAKPEELNGYYNPITKYGKLGGEWAAGRVPFKKPVVMLQAGAVIRDPSFSETNYYGKLQHHIHRQPEIVQYGFAFPFPICLKEEDQ